MVCFMLRFIFMVCFMVCFISVLLSGLFYLRCAFLYALSMFLGNAIGASLRCAAQLGSQVFEAAVHQRPPVVGDGEPHVHGAV